MQVIDVTNRADRYDMFARMHNRGLGMPLNDDPLLPIIPRFDNMIVNVISPNLEDGPWIAGGACRAWFCGKTVDYSDIDVYFKTDAQLAITKETLVNVGATIIVETPNAITMHVRYDGPELGHYNYTIQLILRYCNSADELLNNFDISVCKIATDGYRFYIPDPNTAYDIRHNILRMTRPLRPSAGRRLVKYWSYGFTPSDELIDAITSSTVVTWDKNEDEYVDILC